MPGIELNDYLNQTKAAEMIGVHRATIWRWMDEDKITSILVGGLRMIPRSEVDRIIREKELAVKGASLTA